MGSKAKSVDKTTDTNKTSVVDRRAIQEQGNQILDSIIIDPSDQSLLEVMNTFRASFQTLTSSNNLSVGELMELAESLFDKIQKGQLSMNDFGFRMLETARSQMLAAQNQGEFVLRIADSTTKSAMSLAQQVLQEQGDNQRIALDILAETKTGDYADTLTYTITAVMVFALAALYIAKGKTL